MPRNKHDNKRGARPDGKKDAGPQEAAPPKVIGCSVPDPQDCIIGKPLEPGAEGVLMLCSNDKCPFKGKMCHEECFAAYEDHLIRVLSTMGSARGWTDAQRRANLWEKKGQSLVAKMCRCRCGLGTTRRDQEYLYNKAKTAEPQPAKKKAKKAKQLPELNFPTQRKPVNNLGKDLPKTTITRQRTESSTSSLDEAYTYRRQEYTYHAPTTPYEPKGYGSLFKDDGEDFNSVSDVFSEPVVHVEIVPAPLPPKQTRSYASAIKSPAVQTKSAPRDEDHDSGHESRISSTAASPNHPKVVEREEDSGRLSQQTFVDSDPTPKTTPLLVYKESHFTTPTRRVENGRRQEQRPLSLSILDDDDEDVAEEEKEHFIDGHTIDDYDTEEEEDYDENMSVYDEEEEEESSSKSENHHLLMLLPEMVEMETLLPVEYIPSWEPLTGRGFSLAEMVFANHRLPGLLQNA